MNAKEFLKTKGVSLHSVNATRLPHKYKNVELELIPLMEEYAKLRLSNVDLATLDDINGVEIVSPHGRSYVGWTFVNEKEVILKNNNRTLRVTAQAHSES